MTGNNNINQFKPESFIPKTYDQFILEDSSVAERENLYPELNYQDASEQRGYGPCSSSKCTCYISQGFVPLNSACPGCGGTVPHQWIHSSCWGRMYISRNLTVQCMNCYTSGHWKDWSYKCEEHQEYKQATSAKAFLTALNIAAGMNASDDGTLDIISEIAIKLIREGRN